MGKYTIRILRVVIINRRGAIGSDVTRSLFLKDDIKITILSPFRFSQWSFFKNFPLSYRMD